MNYNYKRKILTVLFIFIATLLFASSSATVYITANGKKYHRENCRTLTKSKAVTAVSIDEVKRKGYTPCKVCYP